jgi:hypothetical protein
MSNGGIGMEKSCAFIPKLDPFDCSSLLPISFFLGQKGLQLLGDKKPEIPFL